jgi:hypothetical protein
MVNFGNSRNSPEVSPWFSTNLDLLSKKKIIIKKKIKIKTEL